MVSTFYLFFLAGSKVSALPDKNIFLYIGLFFVSLHFGCDLKIGNLKTLALYIFVA